MTSTVPSAFWEALTGRYSPEGELGRGGMATVWLARDLRHDRPVAIKILSESFASAVGRERFLREIAVLARLQHPNILPLIDSGDQAGQLWFAMPFVAGESLRARLTREGKLDIWEAVRLVREAADALAYAHRSGIVHRDVKPENILLSEGHVQVADFGIAQASDAERLTASGASLGTPGYMSPEQVTGGAVGPLSDVYSLGCVLFECLAGDRPFSGSDARAVMARHAIEPAPGLRAFRPGASEALESVIRKSMEKDPVDRWPDARTFAAMLDQCLSGGQPVLRQAPGRGWKATVLLGGLASMGLIAGGLALFHRPASGPIIPTAPPRQITFLGDVTNISLSPDGQFAAYAAGGRGWILDLTAGAAIALTDSMVPSRRNTAWLPDGSGLLVLRDDDVFLVARSGGVPRRYFEVPAVLGGWPGFISERLFDRGVVRQFSHARPEDLGQVIDSLEVHFFNRRVVRVPVPPGVEEIDELDIDSTGQLLLLNTESELLLIEAPGGRVRLREANTPDVQQSQWLPDGRIVMLARSRDHGVTLGAGQPGGLLRRSEWLRSFPGAEDVGEFAYASGARRALLTREISETHILAFGAGGSVPVTAGTGWEVSPSPTRTGDTVYFGGLGTGTFRLFRSVRPWGEQALVPSAPENPRLLALSPDGSRILIGTADTERRHSVLDLTTGRLRKLEVAFTGFIVGTTPYAWLPNSRSAVVPTQGDGGKGKSLALVDVESGASRVVAIRGGLIASPVVSPDGELVAFVGEDTVGTVFRRPGDTSSTSTTVKVQIIRLRDGTGVQDIPASVLGGFPQPLLWSRDDWMYVLVQDGEERSLVRVHPGTGAVEKRGLLLPGQCENARYAEASREVFCEVRTTRSDLWLVEGVDLN